MSGHCRKNFPPVGEQPVVNNHHDCNQHFPLLPNLPWFYPAVVYRLLKISSLPDLLQGATWSCSEHCLQSGLMFPSPRVLGQRHPAPSASVTPSPGCPREELSPGSARGHPIQQLGSCSGSCFHFSPFSNKAGMSIFHCPFCLTGDPDNTGTQDMEIAFIAPFLCLGCVIICSEPGSLGLRV